MQAIRNFLRRAATRARVLRRSRRGVVGILSMMFMIIFGSLAVAMAIASQGNLQTAQTQLRVNRAIGAADTGLTLAEARLTHAAAQFRIEKGEVGADYAMQLWNGTFQLADGRVLYANGDPATAGVRAYLAGLHAADAQTVAIAPEYAVQSDWLASEPIVLEREGNQPTCATQITYVPLPSTGGVRAVVTGYAWDWVSRRWVTRTAQQDFRIFKRVNQAILGPSKIMIGKNVQINGPLGARFTGTDHPNGHPLVVHSDFLGLDPILDQKIRAFYQAVLADDTDGDNRLRTSHTIESRDIASLNAQDYDGNGQPDNGFSDATGDGALDEFDIFLKHFDTNHDGKVALSDALRAGGPYAALTAEFTVDDDLARLIDRAIPDRNGDGKVDARDTVLGYADGVIDAKDRYAKIRGPVAIRSQRASWEAMLDSNGQPVGDYQQFVEGAIRPNPGDRPVTFGAGDDILPAIDSSTFNTANSRLAQDANGAPFATQAGVSGSLWTLQMGASGEVIGQIFNPQIETAIEATPYGAPAAADYYQRPVFRNRTFRNVVIPKGLNGLFINCTFVGVTRVQNHGDNTHASWRFYGVQNADLSLKYPPPPGESQAQLDNDYFTAGIIRPPTFNVPRLNVSGTPYVNTKPLSNNVRFHDCMFVGAIVADRPTDYTHVRNKLQFTGSTRFYQQHPDYPDDPSYNPDSAAMPDIRRSSMMLPHYSVDIGTNNAPQSQDVNLTGLIIAGVLDVRGNTNIDGALLLTFEPTTSDHALQNYGVPVGNPANFNATLGYFGPTDGDQEGFNVTNLTDLDGDGVVDIGYDNNGDGIPDAGATSGTAIHFNGFGRVTVNWDPNLVMPDGLIAPIRIEPLASSYREGRYSGAQQ